jgi:hypothetical protein
MATFGCYQMEDFLNSVGLLLTIVGAGLVFRYGMSYLVRTGYASWKQLL